MAARQPEVRRTAVTRETGGIAIHTPLFDRFERGRSVGLPELARDLADILGARRAIPGNVPGVLAWGLQSIGDFSPSSEEDRERLADQIARAVERFEPRLADVSVTPVEHGGEFRFNLEADLVNRAGGTVRLRILAPRRGGALGADVRLVGGRN